MFDILFECDLIEWTPEGIPLPLIDFVPDEDAE
jgi:hypothetical protein